MELAECHGDRGYGPRRRIRVVKTCYGGWHVDRLGARNRITNGMGFPACHGREFMNCEQEDGSGTFLADVVSDYNGRGGYVRYLLFVNDAQIDFAPPNG